MTTLACYFGEKHDCACPTCPPLELPETRPDPSYLDVRWGDRNFVGGVYLDGQLQHCTAAHADARAGYVVLRKSRSRPDEGHLCPTCGEVATCFEKVIGNVHFVVKGYTYMPAIPVAGATDEPT